MKLFLDRNKTLLPRIDIIYLLTRMMALIGIGWFTFYGDYSQTERTIFYFILGTFAVHLVVFYAAVKEKFDIKLAYLSAIFYDLILIPLMIQHTGEYSSSFYLMYYLTISVAAYVLSFWFATTIALFATLTYLAVIFTELKVENIFDIAMRLGFIWAYYLAISYASDHLRKNEKRLLKLFDTLNLRTSELEKSQAQLHTIYENSRALASMLDSDSVVREVMRIMSEVLGYDSSAIIIRDRSGKLYYRARSADGDSSHHPRPFPPEGTELVSKIIELGEPACLKNIYSRFDYKPLSAQSRSLMLVPLATHGLTMGVLVAEAIDENQFHDRDIQMLTIVARSAALALENAELHRRTEELTINDELTETFNYRYFLQKL
ncbi:MAG: GAF domain-containing protein, partial [Candidatus Zixiibacteriota bacterium]